jgi:hypothetical protein
MHFILMHLDLYFTEKVCNKLIECIGGTQNLLKTANSRSDNAVHGLQQAMDKKGSFVMDVYMAIQNKFNTILAALKAIGLESDEEARKAL